MLLTHGWYVLLACNLSPFGNRVQITYLIHDRTLPWTVFGQVHQNHSKWKLNALKRVMSDSIQTKGNSLAKTLIPSSLRCREYADMNFLRNHASAFPIYHSAFFFKKAAVNKTNDDLKSIWHVTLLVELNWFKWWCQTNCQHYTCRF